MLLLKVSGSFAETRANNSAQLQVHGEMHLSSFLSQGETTDPEFPEHTRLVYTHPAAPADCQNTL